MGFSYVLRSLEKNNNFEDCPSDENLKNFEGSQKSFNKMNEIPWVSGVGVKYPWVYGVYGFKREQKQETLKNEYFGLGLTELHTTQSCCRLKLLTCQINSIPCIHFNEYTMKISRSYFCTVKNNA